MMANAARDPYWQAAVRREVNRPTRAPAPRSRPSARSATCRWRTWEAPARSGSGVRLFANLRRRNRRRSPGQRSSPATASPARAVTRLRRTSSARERASPAVSWSATGVANPPGTRKLFGPYRRRRGTGARLMRSATDFTPSEADPTLKQSEHCATCHTLYTQTRSARAARRLPTLPEQVPYLEWKAERLRQGAGGCQKLPHADGAGPGGDLERARRRRPRRRLEARRFRGGNFLMPTAAQPVPRGARAWTRLPQGARRGLGARDRATSSPGDRPRSRSRGLRVRDGVLRGRGSR